MYYSSCRKDPRAGARTSATCANDTRGEVVKHVTTITVAWAVRADRAGRMLDSLAPPTDHSRDRVDGDRDDHHDDNERADSRPLPNNEDLEDDQRLLVVAVEGADRVDAQAAAAGEESQAVMTGKSSSRRSARYVGVAPEGTAVPISAVWKPASWAG